MRIKLTPIFKTGLWIIVCLFSISACSQQIPDINMKWIAKYDFLDLYKVKVNGGYFNPGSAITIREISMLNENTIILGAEKEERLFPNSDKKPNALVLFISRDKGKTYTEVKLDGSYLFYLNSKEKYTLIEVSKQGPNAAKVTIIYLLDHKTFEIQKVDEYIEPTKYSNYTYLDFDGEYIMLEKYGKYTIVNLLNKSEEYAIPVEKLGKSFYHIGNGKIVTQIDQAIIAYDVKTKEFSVLSQLKNNYDYFFYMNDQLILKKIEFNDGEKFRTGIYDIYENKLYTETHENKYFYRYKNFVCDYRGIGVKPKIRYSYDYGETWKTHQVQDFTILQNIFGFYKDEFLVTEGIFFRGSSPESGGRVMVGEFVKD